MFRHLIAATIVLPILAGSVVAADKEVKGKIVKVDVKKNVITVMTEDDKKNTTSTKLRSSSIPKAASAIKESRMTAWSWARK